MVEVKEMKRRYGKLNTIVMNAVLEACVHCGNVDAALDLFDEMSKAGGCGVDTISFSTLLKVSLPRVSLTFGTIFTSLLGLKCLISPTLCLGFGEGRKNRRSISNAGIN